LVVISWPVIAIPLVRVVAVLGWVVGIVMGPGQTDIPSATQPHSVRDFFIGPKTAGDLKQYLKSRVRSGSVPR